MDQAKLIQQLERDEGLRLRAYRDTVGKLTIGVGRNLDDVGISRDEARVLLLNDINRVVMDLNKYMPWWTQMTEDVQLVLANMCFNLGIGRLLGFKRFLNALRMKRWQEARHHMLDSLWADQVGARSRRLADMVWKPGEPTGVVDG